MLEPAVLFAAGGAVLVGVDHEELGIADSEGVVVLGGGEAEVIVVPVGVLFVVANDGKGGDVSEEAGGWFEEVVDPLMLGEAVIYDITTVEHEIGAKGEDAFGALAGNVWIALGITKNAEGPGHVRRWKSLEGEDVAAGDVLMLIHASDAVEISGEGFEVRESEFVNGGGLGGGDVVGEGLVFGVFNGHERRGGGLSHDGDGIGGGELEVWFDDELEELVDGGAVFEECAILVHGVLDFVLREDTRVEFGFVEGPVHGVEFVIVGIGAEDEAAGGRVEDIPGLGGGLAGEFSIEVEAHGGSVIGGGEVLPLAEGEWRGGTEAGEFAVAIVGAFGGEDEGERVLVVAEQPAFFEIAVVLDEADDAAIGKGVVEEDPCGDGEFAFGQERGRGFGGIADDEVVVEAVEEKDLGGAEVGVSRLADEVGVSAMGEVLPGIVLRFVRAGGEVDEEIALDFVGVGRGKGEGKGEDGDWKRFHRGEDGDLSGRSEGKRELWEELFKGMWREGK